MGSPGQTGREWDWVGLGWVGLGWVGFGGAGRGGCAEGTVTLLQAGSATALPSHTSRNPPPPPPPPPNAGAEPVSFPWKLTGISLAVLFAVAVGISVGLHAARKQRRKRAPLWLPPGFAPRREPRNYKRREPVGEDAIGMKILNQETDCEDEEDNQNSLADGPPNHKKSK
ncbi:hypothetical protein chiPu_0022363, partial [Chiloscyllium punctatum]|nr:hypothetical protein [Chiloscyllium punctatum]